MVITSNPVGSGPGDPTESWLLWAWMCPGVGYRPLRVPPTLLPSGQCAARASWLCLLFLLQRFDSIPTWLQRSPGKCLKRCLRWEHFLLSIFHSVLGLGLGSQHWFYHPVFVSPSDPVSAFSLFLCVVSSPWEMRSWRHRARSVFC